MSNTNRTAGRNRRGAMAAAVVLLIAAIGPSPARAAGVCALVPNDKTPGEKTLQCNRAEGLTVHAAQGTRYRMVYTKGDPVPAAIRLDDGALLIEYQGSLWRGNFQILTPLAIAAVRGTKWAIDVTKAHNSMLVLDGVVGVTNRRLNEYVIVTAGGGRRHHADGHVDRPENLGSGRKRALLARFGE